MHAISSIAIHRAFLKPDVAKVKKLRLSSDGPIHEGAVIVIKSNKVPEDGNED